MAQGIRLERDKFSCSICLDLLHDPVTVPCGHSYCMSCIQEYFDTQDYRCPQCREVFVLRPVLVRNNMLAFVVEELKKTVVEAAPDDTCHAAPEDVLCDVCTGRKQNAFKSCLQCCTSYCEYHLQPHYDVALLKTHKLVEPSAKFQKSICSRHQEEMKLFCRTDQQCICYLCSKDNHKGHSKVSAAAERDARQRELGLTREKIQQRIQNKERDVKMVQQEEGSVNRSADNALRSTDEIFGELICVIEEKISEVKECIKSQQITEMGRFRRVREKVQHEIAELRRKDAQLEKLFQAEDHTYFLLNYLSLSHMDIPKDPPTAKVCHVQYFEKVTKALLEAGEKLQEVLDEECAKITVTKYVVASNSQAEPRTRAEFLQYACQITLDPNTSNTHLSISEEKRRATFMSEEQKYCVHPERFAFSWQVLGKEGLIGKCYWEVERSREGVLVALAYKDISRDGNFSECVFGNNDKSWALDCYHNTYEFRHDYIKTHIAGMWSSRVGVYLDHRAGILSFYSVSETMTLLHRVQTTFTQPLYAGLWLSYGATAELCKLK